MSRPPKSWLAGLGDSVVCSPVPERSATASAAPVGVTVTVPVFEPTDVGSKRTTTVHDALGARLVVPASHVPPLRVKPWPDDTATVVIGSVFGPEFVNVNV